jgi:hypothetical protein
MNVGSFLITDAQSPKLIEPSESSFHDPSPSAQSTAVLSVTLCQKRLNMPGAQTLPDRLRVITTIAQHAIRTMAWTSSLSL